MSGTSDAGRSHVDLARIGFGMGDELGDRLGGNRWMDLYYVRLAANPRDRRDVTEEIEASLS